MVLKVDKYKLVNGFLVILGKIKLNIESRNSFRRWSFFILWVVKELVGRYRIQISK